MDKLGWIFGLFCLLASAAVVIGNRIYIRKIMGSIERMLDAAKEGSFSEKSFDESRMSALETRFADYLLFSAVSARNVAVEKDKIKTMIADISHQSKMPVANLLLYSELLKEEELSLSARQSVEALYAQTEKLRFLIDALVKLSRLENGIISLSPRREAVGPVLKEVVEQFALKAEAKGLFLQLEDTAEKVMASFDSKWTREALCNIVDNAIKYTEHGGITISVIRYEMFIRIDIADTGMGISREEQPKIFSRFYRSSQIRNDDGVGIGLYLVREIIFGEGGYIKVASTVGEGSVFSVFLPS